MAHAAGSHAQGAQAARTALLALLAILVLLLLWGILLAPTVRAQATSCPPDPVFDTAGRLDETAYTERLEQCFREEQAQQLEAYLQVRAQTPEGMSAAGTAVLEQDSLALVALYNSTKGSGWWTKTNWLNGPVSTWHGVTVSGARIVSLSLSGNNLSGSIPPELGNLDSLQYLYLYSNELSGSIPPELGNLANLQHLYLYSNQLSGGIPPALGNLANLLSLHLSNNQLSGSIPPALGNLANLQKLFLSRNQIRGSIPPEVGNLANLQYLFLESNRLNGNLPPELGNLFDLHVLHLSTNLLSGALPLSLMQLEQLDSFSFANTNLCVPQDPAFLAWLQAISSVASSSLRCMTTPVVKQDSLALVALYNSTNGPNWTNDTSWLSGPASTWYGVKVSNGRVTDLTLAYNGLRGSIPPELGSLANLQLIDIANNQLSGNIPPELGNLANLQSLSLQTNQLSGSIPAQLGSLFMLQELHLHDNQFTGDIPSDLGNLANLENLGLSHNQLSGDLPAELGSLVNLQQLYLEDNQLTGNIPPELGKLSSLQYLYLSGNQLNGNIPSELGNLSNLRQLYLYSNQLSGSIPSELGTLSNLQFLRLSSNQLDGSIPSELGNLSDLQWLFLNDNQLSGAIPLSFINLTSLSTFDFSATSLCEPSEPSFQVWLRNVSDVTSSGLACTTVVEQDSLALVALYNSTDGPNWTNNTNWLSGPVPTWYGITVSSTRVTLLNLSANQLTGSIPSELGNLDSLQHLDLSANQLNGSLPSALGILANLKKLFLSGNQLSGSIPLELSDLSRLTNLELSSNQLSGSIPLELGSLPNLQYLNIDSNQLNGSIPPELGNLANLQELNLSTNQLSGSIPPELGNLWNLTSLGLSANLLSGALPLSLMQLERLEAFSFTNTNLCVPQDPAFLAWLQAIRFVVSSGLSCSTPPTPVVEQDSLALVALYNSTDGPNWMNNTNWLSGPVSTWYGVTVSDEHVTVLTLSSNQLSGSLPPELGDLDSLQYLALYSNQLSGSIPPELGNLSNLRNLFLQSNPLSGAIPLSFTNLTSLATFDFSATSLCEPTEPSFQVWLRNVIDVTSTGVSCDSEPIVITWINPAGGSWHDATNWLPAIVPGERDIVQIPDTLAPAGSPTILTITLNEDVTVASIKTLTYQECCGDAYPGPSMVTFSSDTHALSVTGDVIATGQEYSTGIGWTMVFDCPVDTIGSAWANQNIYSSILFKKSVQEIGEVTGPIVFEGPVDRVGTVTLLKGNISFREDVREVEEVYLSHSEGNVFSSHTLSFNSVSWIGTISSWPDRLDAVAEVSIGRIDSIGSIELGPVGYITHHGTEDEEVLWIDSVELTPAEPYGDGSTTFGIDLGERRVHIDTLYIGKNRYLKSGVLAVQSKTTLEPESVLDISGNISLLGDATIGIFGPNLKSEEDTLRLQRAHYIENHGAPILNGVLLVEESLNTAAEIAATGLIAKTGAAVKALYGNTEELKIEAKAVMEVEGLYSSRTLNDGTISTRILWNRSLNPCTVTNNGLLEISAHQNNLEDFYEVSCDTVANQGVFSISEGVDVTLRLFTNAESGLLLGEGVFSDTTQFVSAGGIVPGDSSTAGTIHFKDGLVLQTTTRLDVDLGGLEPGAAHDQLVVDGAAQLAGLLHVDLLEGYVPALADSFRVLRLHGSYTGTFAHVSLPALPGDLQLAPHYDARGLLLVVVPAQGGTPPLAAPDTLTVTSTAPVLLDVLANDDPLDADSVKVVYVSHPSQQGGSVAISADSLGVIYQAPRGYVGPDTFSYTIRDNLQDTARASVFLTIANTLPTATDDAVETTVNTPVVIDVLANDDDADGDSLFLAAVDTPAHGTAEVADGRVTYTPEDGYVGEDRFEYTVEDERDGRATASVVVTVKQGTGVDDAADIPTAFKLEQNYPNPFNPATTIRYALPEACRVRLVVFDALGREVAVLVSTFEAPGHHTVTWEAGLLPSGLYLYHLEAGSFADTRPMLLLK